MTEPAGLWPTRRAWLRLPKPARLAETARLGPAEPARLGLAEPGALGLARAAGLLGLAHAGAWLAGCALDLAAYHCWVTAKVVDEFPFVVFFAAVVDLHRRRFPGAGHASDAGPKLLTT